MIATLVKSIRMPFLILVPVCIFLATSLVTYENTHVDWLVLFLALAAALFAHVSVNALNEYQDFHSGLDAHTKRTPFSGGSGALIAAPHMDKWVLYIALISLLVTITIGLFFYYLRGTVILVYGAIGILLILTYTRWLNKYAVPCLIAPGLGFGTIMVTGGHFALSGQHTLGSVLAGLLVFLLTNNLLLLNQFPDIDADRQAGRNHMVIRYGTNIASNVYACISVMAILTLVLALITSIFPASAAIALLPLLASYYCFWGCKKYGKELGKQPQILAVNTIITLITPVLIAITLVST
ncbi:prenyltransferase [Thalassotalea mangrovi]|uniref:Prenyltransferase n=1 Tax=Thalassotalea mangrovi TaxID=2572245 RepID=A0A4U1BAV8_9GAMM|nr:prenyltransferase [Thalassotalea mangrovi]TKB47688.1 prenyltransferase [Thalassotalea mangrovi]